jgi:dephospho-CoA kinase
LGGVEGASNAKFDHIGSTSVPGLAAKPYIDLQVRILPLPSQPELTRHLEPLGYRQEHGARPDSPGVTRDSPRGHEVVDDDVWEKRLYVHPAQGVILHFRRADSPWGQYTVWFRDWLRENPEALARYGSTKRDLSKANQGKPDVDDYTRAKTAFFDEVQAEFTRWACSRS